MLYVERNEQGEIVCVSQVAGAPGAETKTTIDSEILEFLSKNSAQESMFHLLAKMDTEIVRILEDLIDILVNKNLILFSELPHEAQEKLLCRKHIRKRINNGALIVDDADIL